MATKEEGATQSTQEVKTDEAQKVLEKVGKAAIKEHGLAEVYVTKDGTVFRTENDAKNYALNLKNKNILIVKS